MAQPLLAPLAALDHATDEPEGVDDASARRVVDFYDRPPLSKDMSSAPTPRCQLNGKKPLFHLRVCVPGHQSAISPVVQALMGVVREIQCVAGKEFEIETALREALANAVVHGCRNDASKVVECELSCIESEELIIVVRDPGPGFDPASVPNPVTGENVYSTHGRGIYLIKQLMDDVWFERGGNEIHMRASGPTPPAVQEVERVPVDETG